MGQTFSEAIANCNENQKIIYGTRSEKWHIIESDDRDWNTKFCMDASTAKELGEVKATIRSIGR